MLQKKTIGAVVGTLLLGLSIGWFGRPQLDSNYISAEELYAEDSPVVVVSKEELGSFLIYVENLTRAFKQCQAGKLI